VCSGESPPRPRTHSPVLQCGSDGAPISANSERVIERLDALLIAFASGPPDRLVNALSGSSPSTLRWICWRADRLNSPSTLPDVPFQGWKEFSDVVLSAADLSPGILIPQLVRLLVSYSEKVDFRDGRPVQEELFDRGRAEKLFDLTRLEGVFTRFALPNNQESVDLQRGYSLVMAGLQPALVEARTERMEE
jgi:hypothetical protein